MKQNITSTSEISLVLPPSYYPLRVTSNSTDQFYLNGVSQKNGKSLMEEKKLERRGPDNLKKEEEKGRGKEEEGMRMRREGKERFEERESTCLAAQETQQ